MSEQTDLPCDPEFVKGEEPMANVFDKEGNLVRDRPNDIETSIEQHHAAQKPEQLKCRCGCGMIIPDGDMVRIMAEADHLDGALNHSRSMQKALVDELRDEKESLEIAERECKEAQASYNSLLAMTQTTASQLQDEIDRVRS